MAYTEYVASIVPRPCAFVACSTKFAQRIEFRTASELGTGYGIRTYVLSTSTWGYQARGPPNQGNTVLIT